MVHINESAVNFILQNKFLQICLDFMQYDPNFPVMKDWNSILIKNMCEFEEVRNYIKSLKMVDMHFKN